MKEELHLVEPSPEYGQALMDYRHAMLQAHSPMDGCGPLRRCTSPEEFFTVCERSAHRETVPPNHVPATQYLCLREDGSLAGMLNLRHELNPALEQFGGHITYSIRPDLRGQGYGKAQLTLGLEKARELGLERVLITCSRSNQPSRSVILSNGGKLENVVMDLDEGEVVERYWIDLERK